MGPGGGIVQDKPKPFLSLVAAVNLHVLRRPIRLLMLQFLGGEPECLRLTDDNGVCFESASRMPMDVHPELCNGCANLTGAQSTEPWTVHGVFRHNLTCGSAPEFLRRFLGRHCDSLAFMRQVLTEAR